MKRITLARSGGRTTFGVVLAVAVSLTMTACSSSSPSLASDKSGNLVIRVPVLTDLSSLVVMAGADRSTFEAHGLDVKTTTVTDTTTLPALAGKTFDVVCGITPTQWIAAVSNGLDLTAISGMAVDTPQQENAAVLVPKDSKIKTWADLKGARIGTPSVTGTLLLATRKLMKEAGTDPSTVKPVQGATAQLGDLLAAHKFDAITALDPTLTNLESKGYVSLGDPFRAVGDNVIQGICAAPTSYVKAHPDLPKKFRAGLQDSADWIAKDPTGAKKIFLDKSGVPSSLMKGVDLPSYSPSVITANLTAWQNLMYEMGALKKKIDISGHVA